MTRIEEYLAAITAALSGTSPLPEYPAEPAWRLEEFLAAILSAANGDSPVVACPDPVWRLEEYLRAIYDAQTSASPAWPCPAQTTSRMEEYLRAAYDRVATGTETPTPITAWTIEELIKAAVDAIEQTYGPATLVTFNATTAKSMKSLLVSIAPVQDLHGYDHPWPGGGGKNLLPPYSTVETGGLKLTQDDTGRTIIDGIASTVVDFDIPLSLPSGTYTVSLKNPVGISDSYYNTFVAVYNAENTRLGAKLLTQNQVFTITGDVALFRIRIQTGVDLDNFVLYPMIELGSTETSYASYSNICPITGFTGANIYVSPTQNQADATVYNVNWTSEAGTVYGGTVDVVTGKLTVDRVKMTRAWGDFGQPTTLTNTVRRTASLSPAADGSKRADSKSNAAVFVNSTADNVHYQIGLNGDNVNFWLPQDTASDFSVELSYYIATPLTYQLTPQEVQTLVGQNNVWSDAGNVTVVV